MIPEKDNWKFIKSERGPDLPLFKVRYDYQQNLRNGHVLKTLVLESTDSVNVVAITSEQRILMVKQYRFGTGEETGYTGPDWQYTGYIDANAVFMNCYIHHYFVRPVRRTQQMQLDDGENIALLELTIPQVRQFVQEGKIRHPHTLSALARVFPLWKPLIDETLL